MQHHKVKSQIGKVLDSRPARMIRDTTVLVADVVGCTLGPHGRTVLIERQESGLPPFVTKDGVTVYRALGFENPVQDSILELVRDVAVRTASEAGDGTTTATILAAAFIGNILNYVDQNPHVSSQRLSRKIHNILENYGYDFLNANSIAASLDTEDGEKLLTAVAALSANGDTKLADAVIKASKIAGDYGNVIINEAAGPQEYKVERSPGYTLDSGYEDSCKSLYYAWITNNTSQLCQAERPKVILYNGRINSIDTLSSVLGLIAQSQQVIQSGDNEAILKFMVEQKLLPLKKLSELQPHEAAIFNNFINNTTPYVVIVANGFSDNVLGVLQLNWAQNNHIKPIPLVVPMSAIATSQQQCLLDLSAITGGIVHDPVNKKLQNTNLKDIGPGLIGFQCSRVSSTFIGTAVDTAPTTDLQNHYKKRLAERIIEVNKQSESALSVLDKTFHKSRLAKLSGGLALITVVGSSNGDIKERRDRVEDAVFAVRGAQQRGCLPGAGWALVALTDHLRTVLTDEEDLFILNEIIVPSLHKPLFRLLDNSGYNSTEAQAIVEKYLEHAAIYNSKKAEPLCFDLFKNEFVNAVDSGILDSSPAVVESLRSALSIALQAGTMGAIIVYPRDKELERSEASAAIENFRNDDVNDMMGGSGSAV